MIQHVDFSEIGGFRGNNITLNRREHQVTAMYAWGFCDDSIIAEHLAIKKKYVQAITHELRKRYAKPNMSAIVRLYAKDSGLEVFLF
jgi:hypothetical protein